MDSLDILFGDGAEKKFSGDKTASSVSSSRKVPGIRPWVLRGWQDSLGSWVKKSKGVIYCDVCNVEWPIAAVRKSSLSKHAKSIKHLQKVGDIAGAALRLAPSVQEFQDALSRRLKGESFRASSAGPPKEQKLLWTLSEALLDLERKKLSMAYSIGVSQDVQGSTLSVRASCCWGSKLQLSRFLVGYMRAKTGSEGLAQATKALVRNVFTKRQKPPRGWVGKRDVFLQKAMSNFCQKVEA